MHTLASSAHLITAEFPGIKHALPDTLCWFQPWKHWRVSLAMLEWTDDLVWEGDGFPFGGPPLGEVGAVVTSLVHHHGAAECPDAGKHKIRLHQLSVWLTAMGRLLHNRHPAALRISSASMSSHILQVSAIMLPATCQRRELHLRS